MTPPAARRIALPAVATMAALVLTGCSAGAFESTPTDTVYCVDEQNTIVDDTQCDDATRAHGGGVGTSALAWFLIGRYAGGLQPGTRLDPAMSSSRIATTDQTARQAAGLPRTGLVTNGISAATGKPAGIGSKSGTSNGKSGTSSDKPGTSNGKPGGFGGSSGTGG